MIYECIFWLLVLAASCALGLYSFYKICRILYSRQFISNPQSEKYQSNADTNPNCNKNDNSPNLTYKGMSITKIANLINRNKEAYYRYESKYKPKPEVVILLFCHSLTLFPKLCMRVYRKVNGLINRNRGEPLMLFGSTAISVKVCSHSLG